ncbi:MAG: single-stranded-DNA-specific exonuclease RecJ [Brachymonas sp.]
MKLIVREVPPRGAWALEQAGVHPLLARLYAARGVQSLDELDDGLAKLLPPSSMKGCIPAAKLLADAIAANKKLCIVADYDCDGATACAVGLRGLRLLGAKQVSYLVPDRVVDGYGLTASIADRVKAQAADVLITVDNGIASVEGVARATELGLQTLITDHHLPGEKLPLADVIVNPNQPGCTFESKSIAGVGVMFYVLLALRAELRERGVFTQATQPKLDALLPIVALGTVADVVKLDANNRRLVSQGIKRLRAGVSPAGIASLFSAASRKMPIASTFDFGFALGPRVNAAGRLSDMTLGIECLISDDAGRTDELAKQLDAINRERRDIESGMREQAEAALQYMFTNDQPPENHPSGLAIFDPEFHEGVVGIVASRIKDKLHRPTFVFAASGADGQEHLLKGSGRSIAGFHLRDALDWIAKKHPGLLLKFGGHAMAAGCTIEEENFETFEAAFAEIAALWIDQATLARRLETDGPLPAEFRRADMADTLNQTVWGQGFAPPIFSEEMEVVSQRLVAEKHLGLKLKHHGQLVDSIWFNHTEPLPATAHLAYRLESDEWQGVKRVKFFIEGMAL